MEKSGAILKEFRDFIMRGNVVDLAIAVVIGAAFGAVVTSFVNDILLQIIALIAGKQDFSGLSFTIRNAEFRYGNFLTVVIAFVFIAAAVFFFVIRPLNALAARRAKGEVEAPAAPSDEVRLLTEIRDALQRR